MPTQEHPTAAALEAFALGRIDEAASLSLEAHLSECSACQRRVAEAPSDRIVEADFTPPT
jgi:anti-sigma factor RsiW